MEALIDRLDPGHWTHLVLWSVRDAAPTNAFYVSLGMVRDGREALLDRGGPVPLVRFSVVLERIRTNAPTTTVPEAQMVSPATIGTNRVLAERSISDSCQMRRLIPRS
jgi:hypothetical protein